jgi:hypothetical protein
VSTSLQNQDFTVNDFRFRDAGFPAADVVVVVRRHLSLAAGFLQKSVQARRGHFDTVPSARGLTGKLLYELGRKAAVLQVGPRNKLFTAEATPSIARNNGIRFQKGYQVKALYGCISESGTFANSYPTRGPRRLTWK